MLALGADGNHLKMLQQILKAVQDREFMARLDSASSPDQVAEIAAAKFGGRCSGCFDEREG